MLQQFLIAEVYFQKFQIDCKFCKAVKCVVIAVLLSPFTPNLKHILSSFSKHGLKEFFFRRSCLNWCLNSYEKFSIYRRLRLTQNIFCCCVWGRKIVIMNYLCQPFETLCKSASKQNVDYLSLALFSHSFKQEWHKSLEIVDRLLTEKPVIVFWSSFRRVNFVESI